MKKIFMLIVFILNVLSCNNNTKTSENILGNIEREKVTQTYNEYSKIYSKIELEIKKQEIGGLGTELMGINLKLKTLLSELEEVELKKPGSLEITKKIKQGTVLMINFTETLDKKSDDSLITEYINTVSQINKEINRLMEKSNLTTDNSISEKIAYNPKKQEIKKTEDKKENKTQTPDLAGIKLNDLMNNPQLLDFYSKSDLRILRNLIYAQKGYIFQDRELKNIFEAQSWYRGRYENMDSIKLTQREKKFIEEIKRRE